MAGLPWKVQSTCVLMLWPALCPQTRWGRGETTVTSVPWGPRRTVQSHFWHKMHPHICQPLVSVCSLQRLKPHLQF